MTQCAVVPRKADGPPTAASGNILNMDALPEDPLFDFILIPVKKVRKHDREARPSTPWPGGMVPEAISGRLKVLKPDPQEKTVLIPNRRQHRRLLAVMVADAVGYSRLMHDDETATVAFLNANKQMIMREVEAHEGQVVDAPGDNLLAVFTSAVAAVRCAVSLQRHMEQMNRGLTAARRMDFRVGIHLGDVLCQGPSIYGDTVNITARLQRMAEPGGIRISRAVYDQARAVLNLRYEYMGTQPMKNLPSLRSVYRVGGSK